MEQEAIADNLIVCVGHNQRNQELLSQVLAKAGYTVAVALSAEALEATVEQQPIALVLLDISGFSASVWQLCEHLRSHSIPFFIIAPPNSAHLALLHTVQAQLLVKPLAIRNLLTLIAHTLPAIY